MDDLAIYAPKPTVDEILADDWLDAEFQVLEREVLQRDCPHTEEIDTSYWGRNGIYYIYTCVRCGRAIESVKR